MMKLMTASALLFAMATLTTAAGEWYLVKKSPSCPCGWTEYYNQCFIYVAKPMSWAQAEINCQSMNANLASTQSLEEYQMIQRLISDTTQQDGHAWIGASDAIKEKFWFWSDGTPLKYTNWCTGQPDNFQGNQNCAYVNFSDKKCWDDGGCESFIPSVCAKKI
ncbi:ladderlectin-like [Simochromis diagramma]|uniref:Ladderlectin-like n=1 Tax=Haplochromis burtoni TaxID=8153 RepID=A0A3Q2X360_HAPBU|nr:ladderlectin [Haplochromis burtoni]XP_039908255.1 ladderlectin-like [Simochromis diagramma]